MSLWSNLIQTYDAIQSVAGQEEATDNGEEGVGNVLLPLNCTILKTQICVTIDSDGELIRIEKGAKPKQIVIPCSEQSSGRTSKPVPHPLCDQLQYLDREIGGEKVDLYLDQLSRWKADNVYLNAIYWYVLKHSISEDAKQYGTDLLEKDNKGRFKDEKTGVRFAVEVPGGGDPHVENSDEIRKLWRTYLRKNVDQNGRDMLGLPFVSQAANFPKNIVKTAANSKLVSANDNVNFTFRGRFAGRDDALRIDADTSQLIHLTLKWLVNTHGTLTDTQAIVLWAVQTPNEKIVGPGANSLDAVEALLADDEGIHNIQDALVETDYDYARQFGGLLRGFGNPKVLSNHYKTIVLVILDAATSGRLGVTFYREFEESQYLEQLMQWHVDMAWPLSRFDKANQKVVTYIGAPSYRDIINSAYSVEGDRSSKNYQRFSRIVKQQLIECMFGNRRMPKAILESAFHRATRPMSFGPDNLKEWWRSFEVTCSLWKKSFIDDALQSSNPMSSERKEKMMQLDTSRKDRDYLYGRLLALADRFENNVLYKQGIQGTRPTNAVKLMSNFVAKPSTTWLTLYKQLVPYINASNGAPYFQNDIDDVVALFDGDDFEDNSPLSPAFLLGFSCQRRYSMEKAKERKEAATVNS